MSLFNKAEKKDLKLKIAIVGVSGSGKTYSALTLAKSLGKKVAVIDTENKSASLYSDKFDFDVAEMNPPYTIEKYIKAMQEAEAENYDVIVMDSISHAWAGSGGLLERKTMIESASQGRKNSFTAWGDITPLQNRFVETIIACKCHVIVTMRSKTEYVIEMNEKGKSAPRKVGLAPVQRDGMEYEFTTIFEIDDMHRATVSKDRTGMFESYFDVIKPETGEIMKKWLINEIKSPKPATKATVTAKKAG